MKIHKFLLLALLLLTSCEGFKDTDPALFAAPEVTVGKAVVSDKSIAVELSGAISAIDCKAVKECGFYVAKDALLTSKTTVAVAVKEQFSINFTSDEFGTKYYYQAFISNGKYVINSETQSFDIKPFEYYVSVGKPELVGTERTVAKLKASVQWAEGLNLDETGLQYSRNEDFSSASEASQNTGFNTITQDIELEQGVEYYVRAYAKKGSNVAYSEPISVTVSISVTGISLDKTSLSLEKGASQTLIATITPSDAYDKAVTWSTSNSSIATVTDGKVTAIAPGTATITATTRDGSHKATCAVTVISRVTGVSLNKTSLTLTQGASETLIATITPSDATNKAVTWSSNNTSVATVSSTGVVTAKAVGSTTITVTTSDGGKKASCAVTVKAQTISVTGVSLNKTSLSMTVGDKQTLTATISPSTATNKAVTWSSSNTSVATVSSTGVVTAKAVGSTTITVTTSDGGKKATCDLTVKAKTISVTGVSLDKTSLSMTVGDTQTLTATITPSNARNKSVTWSSSNTSVATVSTSGVVTAKATGSTIITVTTQDGGYKAYCSVTVKGTTPDTGRYISFETTSGENQIYYNSGWVFDYTVSLEYSYH